MSKDTAFWEGIYRQQGNAGSRFTPQLATDLSVSPGSPSGSTLQCQFQLEMIKYREERKQKKRNGDGSDLTEDLLLQYLSAGLQ